MFILLNLIVKIKKKKDMNLHKSWSDWILAVFIYMYVPKSLNYVMLHWGPKVLEWPPNEIQKFHLGKNWIIITKVYGND